jgi:heparan-alpha-glucosaminide N-acetyltransferase
MSATPDQRPQVRIASVDAYRGFVMFLMLAGGALHLPKLAKEYPDNPVLMWLGWHQDHVEWRGCTLHDLIQPSFMFLVGVALPFSLANRAARGQSDLRLFIHAVGRSFVLILLAIVHSSDTKTGTNIIFTNVLAQIGLGYPFLFLLGLARPVWHWFAIGVILVGYWAFFAFAPPPAADFDWKSVGVTQKWHEENGLSGFASHWDKNANPALDADRWLLNQFPRRTPFEYSTGGYVTLNFIPALATMIFGLIAGTRLRQPENVWSKITALVLTGLLLLGSGYALDMLGLCPSVKRIWTPSWTLFSGGWCFLLLAGFHALLDTGGPRGWAFPLRVIGMNSIVAYFMPFLFRRLVNDQIDIHIGEGWLSSTFGAGYDQLARGVLVLVSFWLILYWMYCRKIFVRI